MKTNSSPPMEAPIAVKYVIYDLKQTTLVYIIFHVILQH